MQCVSGSGSCRRAQEHIRSKEFRASRNHLINFGRYGIAKNQVTCSCRHPSNRSKMISKRAHCELPRSATPHITSLNCPRQNTIPKIGRPQWRRCRWLQNMTGHSVRATAMTELRCPRWVQLGRTQYEQMFCALPSNSDIARRSRHVSNEPILQNSFCIDQDKFCEPYVRRSNNDLRDYVIA